MTSIEAESEANKSSNETPEERETYNREELIKELGINMDEIMKFSDKALEAFDAGPETLIELPHEELVSELREKQKVIEEVMGRLIEYRNEIHSKMKEERQKRDELNEKVRELSERLRELHAKRKEIQQYIDEKRKELNELRNVLREISERLEVLQREVEGFSLRRERQLKREIAKLEKTLETFNLPPAIEKRLVEKIQALSAELRSFKEKEEKWREINKLKRERDKLRDSIGALRKALALYIQELKNIREEIRELRKERDHYKSKADEYHREYEKLRSKLDATRQLINELRNISYKVRKTLNRLRKLKQQMRHFRAEEEFKEVVLRRLSEIKTKIERGELEMQDLQFLTNFGFLTEDIFDQLISSSPQELAKKVARELGYNK